MAINLQEIRTAVMSYVDTKVAVSISALSPAAGSSINPNEEFGFTLTATNGSLVSGGVPLKDLVWHVWVENEAIAKLIVPAAPIVARSSPYSSAPVLTPGSQVNRMYLFPPDNSLMIGDTDTISLRGRTGGAAAGGMTNIRFKIYAAVDMDWLFPKDQDSPTVTRKLQVIG
jgi:hypothetical protein